MTDLLTDRWQLPDGVDELLPEAAWRVECLRRRIMDCCNTWGFELVMPPIIEYLDSLLTGTGETMDLQTFKLVDQLNGRTLGVRADMTPQVARMDAHALRSDIPNRLFYTGTVLRTRTDGFGGSRSPLQFGAEIFGHAGAESDVEIVRLMLETISQAGADLNTLLLDLGHVGVYRALAREAELDRPQEERLFKALQLGSIPDAHALLASIASDSANRAHLHTLLELRGNESIIGEARQRLTTAGAEVHEALDTVQTVLDAVKSSAPGMTIHIDLTEVRGYRYHTGALFAIYTDAGVELARGGRYDDVGAAFGHARPATGFSGDLKQLADFAHTDRRGRHGIFVPANPGADAWSKICELRASGERVVAALSDASLNAVDMRCDRELRFQEGQWVIQSCT